MSKKTNKPNIALVYDFDNTLIRGNMQEYEFIPTIGMGKKAFWDAVKTYREKNHIDDEVLAYMLLMIEKAKEKNLALKEAYLRRLLEEKVDYFPGVEAWFDRLEKTWGKHLNIKHFIISSGIEEIIQGISIKEKFEKIYACTFCYDEYGRPIWPARVINFTTKMQFLFRINKGTDDPGKLNAYMPEDKRPFPFSHMLYIGDGSNDVPAMKIVKTLGGHSVAVYGESDKKAKQLVREGRAHIALPADYREGADLHTFVETVLSYLLFLHRGSSDEAK